MLSRHIPAALRREIVGRAGDRCEYCRLAQAGQAATFHIDHVVPMDAGGLTVSDNLALACVSCSLHKGARLTAFDPITGQDATIFNPRGQRWNDHFRWDGFQVIGITSIGRATEAALQMNRPIMLAIRAEEALVGRHP